MNIENQNKNLDFSQICRICLTQTNESTKFPIIGTKIESDKTTIVLRNSISLKVTKNDSLPPNICTECVKETYRIFQFRKKSEKNVKFLLSLLKTTKRDSRKLPVLKNETSGVDCDNNETNVEDKEGEYEEIKVLDVSPIQIPNHEIVIKIEQNVSEIDLNERQECSEDKDKSLNCENSQILNTPEIKFEEEETTLQDTKEPHRLKSKENCSNKRTYQCKRCLKEFSGRRNLIEHIKTHRKDTKIECKNCFKEFKQYDCLARHLKFKVCEKKENPYICNFCGLNFQLPTYFKLHLESHNLPNLQSDIEKMKKILPFTCDTCQSSFATANILKIHISVSHGEKNLLCNYCGKAYMFKLHLERHIRTHTGEKPYNCTICKKAFACKPSLKVHTASHATIDPYKCGFCDKEFSTRIFLKNHLRTHSDEKPFKCPHCEKRFPLNKYLQVHLRSHTDERPYKCKVCGIAYRNYMSLKHHHRKTQHSV